MWSTLLYTTEIFPQSHDNIAWLAETATYNIKFRDYVRHSSSLLNDNHWAQIMRLGLVIKGLLDVGIWNEYEYTRLKVKVNDMGLMLFLETLKVLLAGLGDCFAHFKEVLGTFSKLLGSGSDEFLGGDAKVLSGSKVRWLRELLYVAVSASHVTLSCDCGKFSVVYSSVDHINAT